MMMWHCLCIEECNIKMLLMLQSVEQHSDERWLELIVTCSIKYSSFGTLHIGPKQCKHVLEYPGNLLEICSVKSVDTLPWEFTPGQFPQTISLVECIVVILLNLLLIVIYFTYEYGDFIYLFVIIGRHISLIFLIIS